MAILSNQKKSYHKVLINSILNRYNDAAEAQTLIMQRMSDPTITTHMSLKQALKKNKDLSRSLAQVRQERGANLNALNQNAFAQEYKPEEEKSEQEETDEEGVQPAVKKFDDAPTYDFMRGKMEAVIESVSAAMRQTIQDTLTDKIGLNPENAAVGHPSNEKIKQKLKEEKKKMLQKVGTVYQEDEKEQAVVTILNDSETYLEKNLNAASNNLSMLTLHTFEFSKHLE